MHLDIGTGDGAVVQRTAREHRDRLVIGVDANVEGLREVSRKCAARPAKGGLPNALFGRLPLEAAPGELAGLADELTVLLPWGGLLRAVACAEPEALARLRALGKPGASLRVVFGYGPVADGRAIRDLELPWPLDPAAARGLVDRYAAAGLAVSAREMDVDEVRALPTTWAKKLAFSGHERRFLEMCGRVTLPSPG